MRKPENARRGAGPAGAAFAVLAVATFAGVPAAANDPAATDQQRIAVLESRLAALEERPAGQFNLRRSGATLTFDGFVKGDLIHDRNHQLGDLSFGIVGINDGDTERSGTNLHARQSRFGFTVNTPTPLGDLTARVEGDFFGTSNAFRLRHAYGELNGFLVGQTWNLFMPIQSYPSTVDFMGPAGAPFARVNQFRYTHAFDNLTLAGSIERDPGGNRRPVLTGAVSYGFDSAFVRLAALRREVDHPGGRTTGWGVNLSGNAQLWPGGSVSATYTEGDAIASVMVFGAGPAGADIMGAAQNYAAVRTRGLAIGFRQEITDQIGVGLVYGERRNSDNPNAANTDTRRLRTVHATVTYQPVDNVTAGLEAIFSRRAQYDGGSVRNTRLQFATTFSF